MMNSDQHGTWWVELWRKQAPGSYFFEQRGVRSRAFWQTDPDVPLECILVIERSLNVIRVAVYAANGESPAGEAFVAFDVPLHEPLRLIPVAVPKPWGREIWYSGAEKRGTSRVALKTPEGSPVEVALPFVEIALGIALVDRQSALVLLKELDPFDVPFYGELYTEIHLQKSEIYIVSGLGRICCPARHGFVKLGVQVHEAHPSEQSELGVTMAAALSEYEDVRKKVDALLAAGGFDFAAQVAAGALGPQLVLDAKQRLVPAELLKHEEQAYRKASACFQLHEIRLGDIVRVPTHVPHALQPGVRVIEFQTPHYERMILSSNQKVMTQETWDVASGLSLLAPGATDVAAAAITRSEDRAGELVTHVVSFAGLDVLAIGFESNGTGSELAEERQSVKITGLDNTKDVTFVVQILEGSASFELGSTKSVCVAGTSYLLHAPQFVMHRDPGAVTAAKVLVAASVPLTAL